MIWAGRLQARELIRVIEAKDTTATPRSNIFFVGPGKIRSKIAGFVPLPLI
ncbi:hypothetical protein MTHERMOG20_01600 [Moorella thermoacetica]|nr:hypothetical protein MTHERMOG20_01600 [Moorella thermoacetica]